MFQEGDEVICVNVPDKEELSIFPSKHLGMNKIYRIENVWQDGSIGLVTKIPRTIHIKYWYFLPQNFIHADSKRNIAQRILAGEL